MFLCESRPTVKRIIIRFCSIVTSRVNNVTWHMFYQNIDFRNLGNTSFLHIISNYKYWF
jgi:hypothetical protein